MMCVACVSARKYVCVCHVHLSVSVCVYVYVYAHVNNEQYVHGHTSWPHLTGGTSVCTSICTCAAVRAAFMHACVVSTRLTQCSLPRLLLLTTWLCNVAEEPGEAAAEVTGGKRPSSWLWRRMPERAYMLARAGISWLRRPCRLFIKLCLCVCVCVCSCVHVRLSSLMCVYMRVCL